MLTRSRVYVGLIGLIFAASSALADDASDLEKLQRQIDSAKASKQSKSTAPQKAASRSRGSGFRDCGDGSCPEMVWIPKGSFSMGSPDGEIGREQDEGPIHRVDIDYDFAVSASHVTLGQFRQFVSATGHDAGNSCKSWNGGKWIEQNGRNWRNPGFAQGDDHPVVCVNWDDAKAYVNWLSRKTGKSYRLLTEAEYEYAARARTQSVWIWGENGNASCQFGNIADLTAQRSISGASDWTVAQCNDGYAYTAPVKQFNPNRFGLYDMTGNAWSWVEDCYADNYNNTPIDGRAKSGCSSGQRVLRGGSWFSNPQYARVAIRKWGIPDYRLNFNGFRLARTKD